MHRWKKENSCGTALQWHKWKSCSTQILLLSFGYTVHTCTCMYIHACTCTCICTYIHAQCSVIILVVWLLSNRMPCGYYLSWSVHGIILPPHSSWLLTDVQNSGTHALWALYCGGLRRGEHRVWEWALSVHSHDVCKSISPQLLWQHTHPYMYMNNQVYRTP